MENYYLYIVTITPKGDTATVATINMAAKNIAEAASKFMQIPDIDYLYNPDICDITFSCKGPIF